MDGRRAAAVRERTHPVIRSTGGRPRISAGWATFAGLAGPAVAAVCIAVEPAPADPNASEPLIASVIGLALMASYLGAGVAAVRRAPVALTWVLGAALLSMTMTIACPTSGHHALGAWWFVQLVACGALLGGAGYGAIQARRA
jgi:hypothetical protein